MAHKDRIYSRKRSVKTAITVVLLVLLALIIAIFIIFFSFKKYITYTSDGVRLDVPWLQEANELAEARQK